MGERGRFRKIARADLQRIEYQPVNWFRLIAELQRRGWSLSLIARAINAQVSTINAWVNAGTEPRHRNGEKLVHLYERETGQAAPRL